MLISTETVQFLYNESDIFVDINTDPVIFCSKFLLCTVRCILLIYFEQTEGK